MSLNYLIFIIVLVFLIILFITASIILSIEEHRPTINLYVMALLLSMVLSLIIYDASSVKVYMNTPIYSMSLTNDFFVLGLYDDCYYFYTEAGNNYKLDKLSTHNTYVVVDDVEEAYYVYRKDSWQEGFNYIYVPLGTYIMDYNSI